MYYPRPFAREGRGHNRSTTLTSILSLQKEGEEDIGSNPFFVPNHYTTLFFFNSFISAAPIPSQEIKTSSVCWPRSGGGRRIDAGVAENFTGIPAMRTVPAVG